MEQVAAPFDPMQFNRLSIDVDQMCARGYQRLFGADA